MAKGVELLLHTFLTLKNHFFMLYTRTLDPGSRLHIVSTNFGSLDSVSISTRGMRGGRPPFTMSLDLRGEAGFINSRPVQRVVIWNHY